MKQCSFCKKGITGNYYEIEIRQLNRIIYLYVCPECHERAMKALERRSNGQGLQRQALEKSQEI